MKPRIKIDSAILSFFVILTGVLYLNRNLYGPQGLDTLMDFAGLIFILDGILLRMWARGHKKAHSSQSHELVVSGPYAYVRNPMYLGSFLLGVGFVLTVWPWWSLPIFTILFLVRFNKQMKAEEAFLKEKFGDDYKRYVRRTCRFFPPVEKIWSTKIKMKKAFNAQEAFSTHEKRGLLGWPLLAVVFEGLQQKLVYGEFRLSPTVTVAAAAVLFYAGITFFIRQKKRIK